jgi:hypothetical protein
VAFREIVALAILACAPAVNPSRARKGEAVNEQGRAIKEFEDRVEAYAQLHKKLEGGLPAVKQGAEPAEIKAHQEALAKAIADARTSAKVGDIFVEAVRPILRELIQKEFKGPDGAQKRETIREDVNGSSKNQLDAFVPQVNAPYPEGAALTTVPASLLLKLPPLPREAVEYRFATRDLLLRDPVANIVVDVLKEVVPRK